MRSRILAITVAVVVPLAALGVVISRGGDSTHKPARLPILAAGGSAGRSTLGVAQADAALYPYGGIVYKAGPNLPPLDGSARAYKIAAADGDAARRLANAFGFNDIAPDANSTFTSGDAQLTVAPSGQWGFTRQSGGGGLVSSGTAVACPANADCPAPETTIPQHPADLPSHDEARAIALELLKQAGMDTDHATVTVDDFVTQWSVHIDPIVDGLPTEGFGASVAIGERGVIEYANGILGDPTAADSYPLIGTSAAIERLNKGEGFIGPRPMMAVDAGATPPVASAGVSGSAGSAPGGIASGEPTPAPLPPCNGAGAPTTFRCGSQPVEPPVTDTIPPPPPPQEIILTGAEQVLMYAPSYDGSESWLVPAYRFTTSEGVGPTVLAIDDSFLTPPAQVPPGKGSVPPDQPVTIEPQPAPASDPAVKEPSTGR